MAGVKQISITELYNLINQEDLNCNPAAWDENFLLLVDCRSFNRWELGHIILARNMNRILEPQNPNFIPPFHSIKHIDHIVVYDEGNETHADPFSAKKCARVLNELGTRNPVRILRGGYIEFSRKYPFLRVGGKICYSARQLESFFKTMPLELDERVFISSAKTATQSNVHHLQIEGIIYCGVKPKISIVDNIEVTTKSMDEDMIQQILNFISSHSRMLIVCETGRIQAALIAMIYRVKLHAESSEKAESTIRELKHNLILGQRHRKILNGLS